MKRLFRDCTGTVTKTIDKYEFKRLIIVEKHALHLEINRSSTVEEPLLIRLATHPSDPGDLISFLFQEIGHNKFNHDTEGGHWKTPIECALLFGNKKCAIALSAHPKINIQSIFTCTMSHGEMIKVYEYLDQIMANVPPLNARQIKEINNTLHKYGTAERTLSCSRAPDYVKRYMENPYKVHTEMRIKYKQPLSCQIFCLCLLLQNKIFNV